MGSEMCIRDRSGGKQFAKRATMWDALFVGMGTLRRDEGVAALIARVAFWFVVNLTIGLFTAVVGFLFSVWQVGCAASWWAKNAPNVIYVRCDIRQCWGGA